MNIIWQLARPCPFVHVSGNSWSSRVTSLTHKIWEYTVTIKISREGVQSLQSALMRRRREQIPEKLALGRKFSGYQKCWKHVMWKNIPFHPCHEGCFIVFFVIWSIDFDKMITVTVRMLIASCLHASRLAAHPDKPLTPPDILILQGTIHTANPEC